MLFFGVGSGKIDYAPEEHAEGEGDGDVGEESEPPEEEF